MSRLLLAFVMVPVAGSAALSTAGVLVSVGWLTDLLDGRIARRSGQEGRLGAWDLRVDTALGLGVMAGLAMAGLVSLWLPVVAVLLSWPFLVGNVTAAMLIQLGGFVPLLLLLWDRRPSLWWLPFITALLAGIVDWRRLLFVNIPGFLGMRRSTERSPM